MEEFAIRICYKYEKICNYIYYKYFCYNINKTKDNINSCVNTSDYNNVLKVSSV